MDLVVLDTNILISAIVFGGKPRQVFDMVIRGEVKLALSPYLLEELQGVLEGPKFRYPHAMTNTILHELIDMAELVSPVKKFDVVKRDSDDNHVLECAFTAKVDFIISGDEDLLSLKSFQNIPILTADEFLKNFY